MRHRDFVQHLEKFKSDMIAFIKMPKSAKEEVKGPDEILSDDSIVDNTEWRILKHTIESPTFDLKEFTVSFEHFN